MWFLWLIAAIALILSDLHLQAFYALFLGIGAVAACLGAAFHADLWLQGVLFAGVSALGVGLLRPPLSKWLLARSGALTVVPGTHGGFVGQHTVALNDIADDQHPGHVRIGNEEWLAVTDVDGGIKKGTRVEVVALRGTTMLVRPLSSGHTNPAASQRGGK